MKQKTHLVLGLVTFGIFGPSGFCQFKHSYTLYNDAQTGGLETDQLLAPLHIIGSSSSVIVSSRARPLR